MLKFFKLKRGANSPAKGSPPSAEDLIGQIGQEALNAAHGPNDKVLLYAEVEDGVISADLFSQVAEEPVRYRFGSHLLKTLVYEYWKMVADPQKRWAAMSYIIEGGRFNLSFEYPDALSADEDLTDRRPRVVQAQFGDADVDYSQPR